MRHKEGDVMVQSRSGRAFGAHFCLVEIPIEPWTWSGFEEGHWEKNYEIFKARENYSIWPSTFIEMSIFPLLVSWLGVNGNLTLVSADQAESGLFVSRHGLSISQEIFSVPDRISRSSALEEGEIFVRDDPSVQDSIKAQNRQISDDYVCFDFYAYEMGCDAKIEHAFLGRESKYWKECSEKYFLFGSYYMPTCGGDLARFIFLSRSLGNVQMAVSYVEQAFHVLREIKAKSERSSSGHDFLDLMDHAFSSLPVTSPKMVSHPYIQGLS